MIPKSLYVNQNHDKIVNVHEMIPAVKKTFQDISYISFPHFHMSILSLCQFSCVCAASLCTNSNPWSQAFRWFLNIMTQGQDGPVLEPGWRSLRSSCECALTQWIPPSSVENVVLLFALQYKVNWRNSHRNLADSSQKLFIDDRFLSLLPLMQYYRHGNSFSCDTDTIIIKESRLSLTGGFE